MKTIIVHYIPLVRDKTASLQICINECFNFVVLLSREIEICTANSDLINNDLHIQIQEEQDLEQAVFEITALCDQMNIDQCHASFNLKGIKDA